MMRPAKNAPKASEAPAAAVPSADQNDGDQKQLAAAGLENLREGARHNRARGNDDPDDDKRCLSQRHEQANHTAFCLPREEWQHQHDRHHAEILKNQDAGRETAVRGVDLTGIGQHLQHDGGTRQRDQEREKQCHPPAAQEAEADRQRRQDRKTHLRETAGENLPPHLLQPAERELDADREQQEDHADFSESLHIVRI